MKILENVPLAPLTTIGVGGPARFFVAATSEGEVREAVDFARSRQLALFVLGGGSNLVVSDAGFAGLVLKIALGGITSRPGAHGSTLFHAAAGEDWDNFVAATTCAGCAGLECLSGIPGTVGGTPVQNVGAYGQEVAQSISRVDALDTSDGSLREFTGAECSFSYRRSRFNSTDAGRYIVLRVSFALKRDGSAQLAYLDLKRYFGSNAGNVSLAEAREAVLSVRRSKGMVLDPGDPDSHSAGSFFKNPVLDGHQYEDLSMRAAQRGLQVPSYPGLAEQRKVSAAWLVEQAGFPRGYHRGPVGISSKHSLAIVNRGGATAADIILLMTEVREAVGDQFGIELHPEPVLLGFSGAGAAPALGIQSLTAKPKM